MIGSTTDFMYKAISLAPNFKKGSETTLRKWVYRFFKTK